MRRTKLKHMTCPDCGSAMVKLKNARYECRNENCPVIEVRPRRNGVFVVLRDSSMDKHLKPEGLSCET